MLIPTLPSVLRHGPKGWAQAFPLPVLPPILHSGLLGCIQSRLSDFCFGLFPHYYDKLIKMIGCSIYLITLKLIKESSAGYKIVMSVSLFTGIQIFKFYHLCKAFTLLFSHLKYKYHGKQQCCTSVHKVVKIVNCIIFYPF